MKTVSVKGGILLTASVFAIGARAVTITSEFDDRAVKYVIRDATRMIGSFDGEIALKADPTVPDRAWRFVSDGGKRLTVYGLDERGVIYGLYTFLEKYMGCRWYAPDTEKLPDQSGFVVPKLNETGRCAFEHIITSTNDADKPDVFWTLRNKQSEGTAYSVGVNQGLPRGVHTFPDYAREIRKTHPELFGKKPSATPGKVCETLCLTDPKIRELVAEQMIRYIETDRKGSAKYPRYRQKDIYDLAQADGAGGDQCMCESCKAMAEREGSYAGPNIDFCNAVADIVTRKYPDVKVRTLAYAYVADPPKYVVANSNVIVRFCRAWVFDSLVPGKPHAEDLRKWSHHAKRLDIWSYWRTYRGQMYPHVKKRAEIEAEIRFAYANGAVRYYAEDENPTRRSFAFLQHWLLLKLCEDPSRDGAALAAEFMSAYFGAAAKPMTDYLDYLERREEESQTYLDREFFEKVNGWLDEAERLAAGDKKVLRHIRRERTVVDRSMYDKLGGLLKQGFTYDKDKVANRFRDNAVELVKTYSSGDDTFAKVRAEKLREVEAEAKLYAHYPVPVPEMFNGMDVETLEWNQLPINGKCKYVDDPDAAAGTAFIPTGRTFVSPHIFGFYNAQNKQGESRHLYPEDIAQDGKYHPYRIGRGVIVKSIYLYYHGDWQPRTYLRTLGIIPEERDIWISAKFTGPTFVEGSTESDGVYVDRVFLVKSKLADWYEKPDPKEAYLSGVSGAASPGKNLWVSKSLGDPLKHDRALYIHGSLSYADVERTDKPIAALQAVAPSGQVVFGMNLSEIYLGSAQGQNFELVVTPAQLKSRTKRRMEKLPGPYALRIALLVPQASKSSIRFDSLSVTPVREKNRCGTGSCEEGKESGK